MILFRYGFGILQDDELYQVREMFRSTLVEGFMKKLQIAALALMMASSVAVSAQTNIGVEIHKFDLMDLNGTFRGPAEFRGKILGIFLLGHD